MLDELVIRRVATHENGKAAHWPEKTMPLEEVLRLVNRLEGTGMLKTSLKPPEEWILCSEVPEDELANALHEHLSKTGWRRIVEAMLWHNRQNSDLLWDLSKPADFMAAVALMLTRWETMHKDEPSATGEWAPRLWRQVEDRMHEQLKPAEATDWLLSPRALINRLSARARRANTETQLESSLSEAAYRTARIVGTDTERDVAFGRVAQLREQLGNHLQVFCEEQGLPLPRPFSREEAHCLHLLNAYFVALAEAEGMIARRGTALARRQIALEGEWAEVRIDGQLLPGLLGDRREINPLRESWLRERMRHRLALVVGGVLGAVGGGLWGVVEGIGEFLIAGVARYAMVVAPALLVGLMTLVAQTLVYRGSFTFSVLSEFLARALWNGSLTLGAAILVYGCWLYYVMQLNGRDARG